MTNHKKDIQRLLIFLLLAFVITWVPQFVFFSGSDYDLTGGGTNFVLALSMLAPTFAVLITRFVTKEGFAPTGENSLMLGISPAVIVGGIIWGVWHYPATYYGHNFGTGIRAESTVQSA